MFKFFAGTFAIAGLIAAAGTFWFWFFVAWPW